MPRVCQAMVTSSPTKLEGGRGGVCQEPDVNAERRTPTTHYQRNRFSVLG